MRRLIAMAVRNPVAINLLMLVLIVAGGWSAFSLNRETLPQLSFDIIQVSVRFEGATPAEIEQGVVIKIEEAISSIEGIRRSFSQALTGTGFIWAELEPGADHRQAMDAIKDEVATIDTFPDEAEEPQFVELTRRQQVINIAVFGALSEGVIKDAASQIRDDLLATPTISQVKLFGTRNYEIAIEISEANLQRYGLTFEQVRDLVRRSSLDLPGGEIKTPTQDIVVRTAGQRYTASEFAAIPLLTRQGGTVITLGQVARVIDGFEESDRLGRFNGQPAALVSVFKTNDEDALRIAETVRHYVAQQSRRLPAGLSLSIWADTSRVIKGRLQLLTNNGLIGLGLVFLCLWLFMNLRLAFWVSIGLPVAFMGAFWLLDLHGSTLNMITMFACIMALGLLVDDAIVVGENVYSHWSRGKHPAQAAVDGTHEVALPVICAVMTSVAAFLPLFMMEGILGKFIAVLPVVMVAALLTSLLECLIIMPSHLAHSLPTSEKLPPTPPLHTPPFGGGRAPRVRWYHRLRQRIDAAVAWGINSFYRPWLQRALEFRLVVLAAAIALLLLMSGLVLGGHINFLLFPKTDADMILARVTLPPGTPLAQTLQVTERLEAAGQALNQHFQAQEESGAKIVQRVMTITGTQSDFSPTVGSHVGEVMLELLPVERRGISSDAILAKWRQLTGEVPEVLALTFGTLEISPGGAPIEVRLSSDRFADLRQAADQVKAELATYPGVLDIQDDFRPGKMELQLALQPAGRVLGLTLDDLARQVRHGMFGAEAVRLQRGRDEVRVMIRYPLTERGARGALETIRIRTPEGHEVPFVEVATVTKVQGYSVIRHDNRRRVVTVTAEVDTQVANASTVLADLRSRYLPLLMANYEGMRYSFEGQQHETQTSMHSLLQGFVLALLIIYAILATVFRSYVQPLIVMSAIPFGLIGAVLGHFMMGFDLTMMSLFGLVALSGVVVNDSLVLLDLVNRAVRRGTPVFQAVLEGGQARFRAIILTSLTTVAGLLPILAEKSFQAQFLIPMAISISFGLMGATFLTLFLVPALYLILEDIRRLLGWLVSGHWAPAEALAGVPSVAVHPSKRGGV